MTTNLNAIAGPSKLPPSPLLDPDSPLIAMESPPGRGGGGGDVEVDADGGVRVKKGGISVDENGEVVKVPAFLNKLFR